MSAKFKPQKKATKAAEEDVVDDWDASEPEDDAVAKEEAPAASGSSSKTITAKAASADVWDDGASGSGSRDVASGSAVSGRALWENANKSAPPAQPVLAGGMRSLPTSIMAPRISTPSSGRGMRGSSPASGAAGGIPGDEYDARPPPQILRREKPREGSSSNVQAEQLPKKTMAERAIEYQRARERIFGTASTDSTSSDQAPKGSSPAGGRRSGHSSPGSGRNSPSVRQPRP